MGSIAQAPGAAGVTIELADVRLTSGHGVRSQTIDLGKKHVGRVSLGLTLSDTARVVLEFGPRPEMLLWSSRVNIEPGQEQVTFPDRQIAGRYFAVRLEPTTEEPISGVLRSLTLVDTNWRKSPEGSLEFSDESLNAIIESAVHTNQLCVVPGINTLHAAPRVKPSDPGLLNAWSNPPEYLIVDGPRRDMESWIGDVRVQALALYYSHGGYGVARNTIRHFAHLQGRDGRIPGSSASLQSFASYVLWWIVSLYEFYLHSGDLAFVKEIGGHLSRSLNWVLERVTDDGAFVGDRDWMWTVARASTTPASQALFCYASTCASRLLEAVGETARAAKWSSLSDLALTAYRELSTNRHDGAITEQLQIETDTPITFQDSNSLPIAFGLEAGESATQMLAYLEKNMWTPFGSMCTDQELDNPRLRPGSTYYDIFPGTQAEKEASLPALTWAHTRQVWPFANAYEVQARLIAGDVSGALDLTRRCWSTFVREAPGTCWEMVDTKSGPFPTRRFLTEGEGDTFNSASHGWSGWISYVLAAYLVGVRPLEPGFTKTLVQPLPSSIDHIRAEVPTPHGPVSVRIDESAGSVRLCVRAPEAVQLVIETSAYEAAGMDVSIDE